MKLVAPFCLMAGVLTVPAYSAVVSARFTGPTERYNHGILGDGIESQILEITTDNSDDILKHNAVVRHNIYQFRLPLDHVLKIPPPVWQMLTGMVI